MSENNDIRLCNCLELGVTCERILNDKPGVTWVKNIWPGLANSGYEPKEYSVKSRMTCVKNT